MKHEIYNKNKVILRSNKVIAKNGQLWDRFTGQE